MQYHARRMTKEQRSMLMSLVRARNTRFELTILRFISRACGREAIAIESMCAGLEGPQISHLRNISWPFFLIAISGTVAILKTGPIAFRHSGERRSNRISSETEP